MRRNATTSFAVLVLQLLVGTASAQPVPPQPLFWGDKKPVRPTPSISEGGPVPPPVFLVEEKYIRGIASALGDKSPEVRRLAMKEVQWLFGERSEEIDLGLLIERPASFDVPFDISQPTYFNAPETELKWKVSQAQAAAILSDGVKRFVAEKPPEPPPAAGPVRPGVLDWPDPDFGITAARVAVAASETGSKKEQDESRSAAISELHKQLFHGPIEPNAFDPKEEQVLATLRRLGDPVALRQWMDSLNDLRPAVRAAAVKLFREESFWTQTIQVCKWNASLAGVPPGDWHDTVNVIAALGYDKLAVERLDQVLTPKPGNEKLWPDEYLGFVAILAAEHNYKALKDKFLARLKGNEVHPQHVVLVTAVLVKLGAGREAVEVLEQLNKTVAEKPHSRTTVRKVTVTQQVTRKRTLPDGQEIDEVHQVPVEQDVSVVESLVLRHLTIGSALLKAGDTPLAKSVLNQAVDKAWNPASAREATARLARLAPVAPAPPQQRPDFREVWVRASADPRSPDRDSVQKLATNEPIASLALLTDVTTRQAVGRWIAHLGVGTYTGDDAEWYPTLLNHLGRPSGSPPLNTLDSARNFLDAACWGWKKSIDVLGAEKSTVFREEFIPKLLDVLTIYKSKWEKSDSDRLSKLRDQLDAEGNTVGRNLVVLIDEILDRLNPPSNFWAKPEVRSAGYALLFGLVFCVLVWRAPHIRGGRWGPIVESVGTALGITGAKAGLFLQNELARTDVPLLIILIAVEGVTLLGLVIFFPTWLQFVARVEPFRWALPHVMRVSWCRRRFFQPYAAEVEKALDVDGKRKPHGGTPEDAARDHWEHYTKQPGRIQSTTNERAEVVDDPAARVIQFLMTPSDKRTAVIVTGTGGMGKSALRREITRRAVLAFPGNPTGTRLPVCVKASPEKTIRDLILDELKLRKALVAPDMLDAHLAGNDFFVVIDNATESPPTAAKVTEFLNSDARGNTPVVLEVRPVGDFETTTQLHNSAWMTVTPQALGEADLDRFVTGYPGKVLSPALRSACRSPDGRYVPLLVRMALDVSPSTEGADGSRSTAHPIDKLFRAYFLQRGCEDLPEKDNEIERQKRLADVARWCVETHGDDGKRPVKYRADHPLQKALLKALILIDADAGLVAPPARVRFFHDVMQSYLTACGLRDLHEAGYAGAPPLPGSFSEWTLPRVLLQAAANPRFTQFPSNLVMNDVAELFQMCVVVFDFEILCPVLTDELNRWRTKYTVDSTSLTVDQIRDALPQEAVTQVELYRYKRSENCLEKVIKWAGKDVFRLAGVYAGLAKLVYLKETTPANAPSSAGPPPLDE